MKPIYDFIKDQIIPKIQAFNDETMKAISDNKRELPQAAGGMATAFNMYTLENKEFIESLKNQSLGNSQVFGNLKEVFKGIRDGLSGIEIDGPSVEFIEALINSFDKDFYDKLGRTIKDEIGATNNMASIIPEFVIRGIIKSNFEVPDANGGNYSALMKSIMDKALFDPLRDKINAVCANERRPEP